jgi:hypothetical protein
MLTVTLILIIAAFAFFAAAQRIHINNLNAENDRERAGHEVTSELLTEARNEAKNEYELRRQAEKNLAEANDEVDTWRARAMTAESALSKYSRPRDPKTGRFYSAKPRPTVKEMNEGLAAFDAMMGNAIEQLQGLTVRKLCDEVRENATAGI